MVTGLYGVRPSSYSTKEISYIVDHLKNKGRTSCYIIASVDNKVECFPPSTVYYPITET